MDGDWPPEAFWNTRGSFRGRGGRNFGQRNYDNRRGNDNRNWNWGAGGFNNQRGQRGRGFQQNNYRKRRDYGSRKPNLPRETPTKKLSEADICVTEYVSKLPGFNGIIKSRFSDFQVAEISKMGEVAKLTSLEVPQIPSQEPMIEDDEDLLINKYDLELLDMETWDKINKLVVCNTEDVQKVEIDVTGMTKEHRTKIHEAVKRAFGQSIVGHTVAKDDKKYVSFDKYRKGVRVDKRVKWPWPGEFVHCILYKENCDTMEAIIKLTERMRGANHIKPNMVGMAGTKDRRGKTTQWISMRKVDPEKIKNAAKGLREFDVGNYKFEDHNLGLGDLKGNRFRIVLRNVSSESSVVRAACEQLATGGFINYYGLQRFGARPDAPTHTIGAALLTRNYQKAISLILQPSQGSLLNALCEYAMTKSAAAALNLMHPSLRYTTTEGKILVALAKEENNFAGAIDFIPRNTRLLYLHSYQSYVWNNAVSHRIARDGLKPVVGDLVLDADKHGDIEEQTNEESENEDENQDGEHTQQNETDDASITKTQDATISQPNDSNNATETKTNNETVTETDKTAEIKSDDANDQNTALDSKNDEQNTEGGEKQNEDSNKTKKKKKKREFKPPIPVKALTQEDIDSGRYSIFDVILPLPGFTIQYPPNMFDYYKELLAKDNLGLRMKNKSRKLTLSGSYRPLLAMPEGLSYDLVKYNDPYCDLILSDRDELIGNHQLGIVPDGKYTALIIQFSLPSSCYATMALRELLKADTGTDSQALQNDYHKAEGDTLADTAQQKETETDGQRKRKAEDTGEDCKKARIEEEGNSDKVDVDV